MFGRLPIASLLRGTKCGQRTLSALPAIYGHQTNLHGGLSDMRSGGSVPPVVVRGSYEPAYAQLLFLLVSSCLKGSGPRPLVSRFYQNEVVSRIRRHATKILDESGNDITWAVTPRGDKADLKAFHRYLKGAGLSGSIRRHQMVHAYLQVTVPQQLTSINPLRASHAVGRALADFVDEPTLRSRSELVTPDSHRIVAAYRRLRTIRIDRAEQYFVLLPGTSPQYLLWLDIHFQQALEEDATHRNLRFGFCALANNWSVVVARALRSHERYTATVVSRYHAKDLVTGRPPSINLRLHESVSAPARERMAMPSIEGVMGPRVLNSSRTVPSKLLIITALRETDASKIKVLQDKVEKFRLEYL